jgi:hypothetical protein
VYHIFTLEALDMSIVFLLILILAHHLGILNKHWMPCSSTPSCLFFIIKSPPFSWLLGWARFGKVTYLKTFEAHKMR